MDREDGQRSAVGEIAVAKPIGAPINDLTRFVAGLCRSVNDGSEEPDDDDDARSDRHAARGLEFERTKGSALRGEPSLKPSETQNERARMVLPDLAPPMMHIHIAERKRIKKARTKERRDFSRSGRRVRGDGDERTSVMRRFTSCPRDRRHRLVSRTHRQELLVGPSTWRRSRRQSAIRQERGRSLAS